MALLISSEIFKSSLSNFSVPMLYSGNLISAKAFSPIVLIELPILIVLSPVL